jgi:hypothetical protein
MIQRIRDLEEEVRRVKAWEETKQRYELNQPTAGTFVYALKVQGRSAEPAHWICTNCYENGRRSILQLQSHGYGTDQYSCPNCKANIFVLGTLKDLGIA